MSAVYTAVAISAYSSYSSSQANNKAQKVSQAEAERRYKLQASISKEQISEQDALALTKMTEITREFAMAKSKALTVQAESGLAGKSMEKRINILGAKESEAKGKVAQEIDTNKINIARDMLANKIDTESIIKESKAREISSANIAINMVSAGMQGYMIGKQLGSNFNTGSGVNTKITTGINPNSGNIPFDANYLKQLGIG